MSLRMLMRGAAYSAVVFGGAISPVTFIFGLVVNAMSRFDGMVGSPVEVLVTTLGFLATATAAHIGVAATVAPARARIFVCRRWAFAVSCGVLFSIFVVSGIVENSSDVVGRLIGRRHAFAMGVAAVLGWSAFATALIAGLDRVLSPALRKEKQIA